MSKSCQITWRLLPFGLDWGSCASWAGSIIKASDRSIAARLFCRGSSTSLIRKVDGSYALLVTVACCTYNHNHKSTTCYHNHNSCYQNHNNSHVIIMISDHCTNNSAEDFGGREIWVSAQIKGVCMEFFFAYRYDDSFDRPKSNQGPPQAFTLNCWQEVLRNRQLYAIRCTVQQPFRSFVGQIQIWHLRVRNCKGHTGLQSQLLFLRMELKKLFCWGSCQFTSRSIIFLSPKAPSIYLLKRPALTRNLLICK